MKRLAEAASEILKGISEAIESLDPASVEAMLEALLSVKREGKKLARAWAQAGAASWGRPSRCASCTSASTSTSWGRP